MEQAEFEQLVSAGIDAIPEPYQSRIQNVVFQVEKEPTQQQRKDLGLRRCDSLYGLYQGVPLTKRGGMVSSIVPDVITIFMYPMIEQFEGEALARRVKKTVWHEVAHYYGLDHKRIHELETKHY